MPGRNSQRLKRNILSCGGISHACSRSWLSNVRRKSRFDGTKTAVVTPPWRFLFCFSQNLVWLLDSGPQYLVLWKQSSWVDLLLSRRGGAMRSEMKISMLEAEACKLTELRRSHEMQIETGMNVGSTVHEFASSQGTCAGKALQVFFSSMNGSAVSR